MILKKLNDCEVFRSKASQSVQAGFEHFCFARPVLGGTFINLNETFFPFTVNTR